jgi:hypothetical protein
VAESGQPESPAAETQPPEQAEATADANSADNESDKPQAADAAPATQNQANDGDPAATDGDAAAADTPAAADDPAAEDGEAEKPKVETFEDVRQKIAEDLAGPAARRKMDAAITQINSEMRLYFNKKAIHDSNLTVGAPSEAPEPLDLKALGQRLGFEHEVIGPYNEITIAEEPISESFELGTRQGADQQIQRGPAFRYMMFGLETQQGMIPPQPLYSPLRTADDQTGKMYVTWKTAETPAYTPELEQVRDEVVMAVRMREARELALQEAKRIAKEAAEGKPLADLVPADRKDNLKEGIGPFSWLNMLGFQGVTIGNVPELDSVGNEFMKTVFQTEVNKYGVALNQPERVVYVVQPRSFQPPTAELQRQFTVEFNRRMAQSVGAGDAERIIQGFYKSLDERTGFESNIEP